MATAQAPELTLRPAVDADLPAIAGIYAHAVREGTASYELEPPSLAEMTIRFNALHSSGFPYLVAEDNGAVVAYAYAGPFRPRPAYRFIVEDSIYVAPSAKGRGVGRSLLERLIEDVRQLGFRQIIAVIGDGHESSASVRLHRRLGFADSGRLAGSGYKHGRWLDTVFMQLSLNGGAALPPDPQSMPERMFRGEA
ncbi:MAG: N-acetyltransferase [Rhizobiaceae bacterium]|nr:N-acetyltransferase [Rhizobiaceae bacterium]